MLKVQGHLLLVVRLYHIISTPDTFQESKISVQWK